MAASDFLNVFEVVTGHYKNEVNLAGGHFLSSLFSLLSSPCFLPPRPRTRRGQGHGDCICAIDSCDAITTHPLNVRFEPSIDLDLWGRTISKPSRRPSVLSSLSPLFPLLSLLPISQIALRTCPFDLCMRPSTSHPTASTPLWDLWRPREASRDFF